MPLDLFRKYVNEAVIDNVVAVSISTRPDCIAREHLEILKQLQDEKRRHHHRAWTANIEQQNTEDNQQTTHSC